MTNPPPQRLGRVLGVDPGTVRVGLAVSDPDRLLATPHDTLTVRRRSPARKVARLVLEVATELACTAIVVGLPLSLSGGETRSTQLARDLADAIRTAAPDLPVEFQDERYSSVAADRVLAAGGRSGSDARAVRDQAAAVVLLQTWLDSVR